MQVNDHEIKFYANLYGANLQGVYLRGADLRGADLPESLNIPQGELIVHKKVCDDKIVKLLIPAEAKRSKGTSNKYRAEFAIVLEADGICVSIHDRTFTYETGKTVYPREPFCEDRWNECSSGIHFFLTEEEARAY